MYILVVCIDGQTPTDLATGLRETLRRVEAGELAGEESEEQKSYHFKITPPRVEAEAEESN